MNECYCNDLPLKRSYVICETLFDREKTIVLENKGILLTNYNEGIDLL